MFAPDALESDCRRTEQQQPFALWREDVEPELGALY
jgi:hypothetical protein